MNAASIIGDLMADDYALADVVPVARQKAGRLPDGIALPALLVREVSLVDRQTLKRGTVVRQVSRVAVTVRAESYRQQVEVMGLVRAICAGRTGTIAGAQNVSVLTAGLGPDINGPGNSFEKTQDFRVSFDAPY